VFNFFFIPFEGTLTLRYIVFGLTLPFGVLAYLVFSAKKAADYHQAASLCKFIMLIGLLYGFVFYFLQAKTYGFSIFNLFIVQ
jgi:4-hydroxybenzoate polyprenyltransferase